MDGTKQDDEDNSEPKGSSLKNLIPLSHEIVFPEVSAHLKGITAMALDRHCGT